MDCHRAIIFGTSRLHRPFASRIGGQTKTNTDPMGRYSIVFPKIGYFHTAAEVLQAIMFLTDKKNLPCDLLKYVFRAEPKGTTPLNEFDPVLKDCINENKKYNSQVDFNNIQSIVFEISSLSINKHIATGTVLHANPNFLTDVPYRDIYPEGYYKKYEPDLQVEKMETTLDILISQINNLKLYFPSKNLVILSHLRSEKYPNALIEKIHLVVRAACLETGCTYFDTAPILDVCGFAENDGATDIHHMSPSGEYEMS